MFGFEICNHCQGGVPKGEGQDNHSNPKYSPMLVEPVQEQSKQIFWKAVQLFINKQKGKRK